MIEQARYQPSPIEEFRGNPLIEALPSPRTDDEIYGKLYFFPSCNENERELPAHIRKLLVSRLDKLIIPRPEYFSFFHAVEELILRGYESKNPNSATTNHWLHYLSPDASSVVPHSGVFHSNARATTVFGPSGVGKSKMIEQVLPLFPQRIEHRPHDRASLGIEQLVYLEVECPSNASVSALCRAIIGQYEMATGSRISAMRKRMSISDLQDVVDQLVRSSFLGVIVIDELSNISIQRAGGQRQFLQFLLRLMNTAGVPFVLVGTEELQGILSGEQWTSRRCESGGVIHMPPMTEALWSLFVNRMWKFQWTDIPTELTEDLSRQLAKLSKGLPDPAIRTFREAQKTVIGTGDERITTAVLRDAFRIATTLSKDHIATLPSIDAPKPEASPVDLEDKPEQETTGVAASLTNRIPDVQRVQHPEFASVINSAISQAAILPLGFDSNVLRDSREHRSPLKFLAESGVLLEDPVNFETAFRLDQAETS